MAKYYGSIGFEATEETSPGIYEEQIVTRKYYGDVLRNVRKLENGVSINDDVNISNQISIVADPYANKNFHSMRYAEFMGTRWKITSIEVQYPRLILTLGGEYPNDT